MSRGAPSFFLNLPIAVVVVAISLRCLPESRDDTENEALDWPGSALAALGLGALVYGLIESSRSGFGNPAVLGELTGGILVLVIFLGWEARTPSPMLPPSLFRSRDFTGANILTLLLYAALGGTLFFCRSI